MDLTIQQALEKRLGSVHARQRLGIEQDTGLRVFGGGLNFFHPENWYSFHALIRYSLKASGLYWRGRKNSLNHQNEYWLVQSYENRAGIESSL